MTYYPNSVPWYVWTSPKDDEPMYIVYADSEAHAIGERK